MRKTTATTILDFVRKNKRVKSDDIITHIKLSDRAVYKSLSRLVLSGQLIRHGEPPKVYYTIGKSPEYVLETASTLEMPISTHLDHLTNMLPPITKIFLIIQKNGKILFSGRENALSLPGDYMKYHDTISETVGRILKQYVKGMEISVTSTILLSQSVSTTADCACLNISYICDYSAGLTPARDFKWLDRATALADSRVAIESKVVLSSISKPAIFNKVSVSGKSSHIVMFNSEGDILLLLTPGNITNPNSRWVIATIPHVMGHNINQSAALAVLGSYGVNPSLTFRRSGLKTDAAGEEKYYLYYGVSNGPYCFDRSKYQEIHKFDCEKLLKGNYDKSYDIDSLVYDYVLELRDVWTTIKEGGVF